MGYVEPFLVGNQLFVEQLSSTPPFFIHRTIDLGEENFTWFKSFKNLSSAHLDNRMFTVDLEHEAETLQALSTPAVPQVYSHGVMKGRPYLTYRYIWGRTLLQILRELKKRKKMLSAPYATFIAHEVCRTLAQAHEHRSSGFPDGIVHRNLSPRHIIISFSGKVHVVGFGHKGPNLNPENLESFDFRNLSYLSPEQITHEPVAASSDLFTLGSIFYEMLTGTPPFLEKTGAKVLNRITKCSYVAPSCVNPSISREMDLLLARNLTAYSSDRFSCVNEMREELARILLRDSPDFSESRITWLMKSLFNKEIIEDIRHFKQLGDHFTHKKQLLLQSIPRIMFEQIREDRKKSGFSTKNMSMDGVNLSEPEEPEKSADPEPDPTPVQAPEEKSNHAVSAFESLEDMEKTRLHPEPPQRQFFEEEDTVLAGNVIRPGILPIKVARSILDSGEFHCDLPENLKMDHVPAPVLPDDDFPEEEEEDNEKTRMQMSEHLQRFGFPAAGKPGQQQMQKTRMGYPDGRPYDAKAIITESDFRTKLIGRTLGEYTITGILGWGGMGTVFDGMQTTIGKEVAIKVLNPQLCSNQEMASRFLSEARAVNSIRNPHIIDIFSFGAFDEKYHYFVMEKLNGETLATYLSRNGTVPFEVGHEILLQVFNAVQAAHEKQIVHRDLKPDNIYIEKRALFAHYVKILDFGIAKFNADGLKNAITQFGLPLGTPQYMSPEQCMSQPVTAASDIYSLGVILYEMFTGSLPFPRKNSFFDVLMAQIKEQPISPSKLVSISPTLEKIIMWTLNKDPLLRPGSVQELADNLLPCLKSLS